MAKKRINITIDPELYSLLQEQAYTHCHSVSNEIEYRLKQSFGTPVPSEYPPFTAPALQPPFEPTAATTTTTKKSTIAPAPKKPTPVDKAIEWLDANQIDIFSTDPTAFVQAFPTQNASVFDEAQMIRRNKSRTGA